MEQIEITFVEKMSVATETYRYVFAKPEGFTFRAGQYVIIEPGVGEHADEKPAFRSLTISSAPHEDTLSFVVRDGQSAFKKNMCELEPGDKCKIRGPLGHMSLPTDPSTPAVFLCAGVGITPARSMLRDAQHRSDSRQFILINSNRSVSAAPCYEELLSIELKQFTMHNIMTDDSDGWDGPVGRVDTQFIQRVVEGLECPMYYIVGTKGYVEAMKACLAELEVPTENIQIDNFG